MNIFVLEKKYNISFSSSYEDLTNFASKEYVKANLADILLCGEKINDYVSKKNQEKKEKENL